MPLRFAAYCRRSVLAEKAFQAVGALAGVLRGGELEVLTGERFPATLSPTLQQWLAKNPEAGETMRIWLAYPRTTGSGGEEPGLAFYLVGTPEDQDAAQWQRQVDRFNIKGQVVVSRAGRDNTVVWIPRNDAAPINKRRHPDWKGRVLFLKRALRPVRKWKGADVWIEAKRIGRELVITQYQQLQHHPTTLRLPSGWAVPWPFRPTRSSVMALCKESLAGAEPCAGYGVDVEGYPMAAADWVALYDDRPRLRRLLLQFNQLQKLRATDLLPRQALYEGRPMTKQEIGRELSQAEAWERFFKAMLRYLEELDPGQYVAVAKRCDPWQALVEPVRKQARAWFELEPAGPGRWKVWYEGAPVPNRVKKAALAFFADEGGLSANTPPAAPPSLGGGALEEAVAYFRSIGCPATYTPRQTAAWMVQSLAAEGLTDEQITTFGWLRSDLLAELKRIELPHKLDS